MPVGTREGLGRRSLESRNPDSVIRRGIFVVEFGVVEVPVFGYLVDGSVDGEGEGVVAFGEDFLDFEHAGEGEAGETVDTHGGVALLEGEGIIGPVNETAGEQAEEDDLIFEGGGVDAVDGGELGAVEAGGVEAVFEGVRQSTAVGCPWGRRGAWGLLIGRRKCRSWEDSLGRRKYRSFPVTLYTNNSLRISIQTRKKQPRGSPL